MANPSSVELDGNISQHLTAFSQQAKKLYAVMEQKSRGIAASLASGALNIESIKEPDMLEHLPAKIVLVRRQKGSMNINKSVFHRMSWEVATSLHDVASTVFQKVTYLDQADAHEIASGREKSLQDILLKLSEVSAKFKELIILTPEQKSFIELLEQRWHDTESHKNNGQNMHEYLQTHVVTSMLAWSSDADHWNFTWHLRVLQSWHTVRHFGHFSVNLKNEIMSLSQLRDKILQIASKRDANEAKADQTEGGNEGQK